MLKRKKEQGKRRCEAFRQHRILGKISNFVNLPLIRGKVRSREERK